MALNGDHIRGVDRDGCALTDEIHRDYEAVFGVLSAEHPSDAHEWPLDDLNPHADFDARARVEAKRAANERLKASDLGIFHRLWAPGRADDPPDPHSCDDI